MDWTQAVDDGTASNQLRYQIHTSNIPNFTPSVATLRQEVTGELSASLSDLPTTLTYFIVRAIDSVNNASDSDEKSVMVSSGILQITNTPIKKLKEVVTTGATIDTNGNVPVSTQAQVNDIIISSASGGILVRIDSIDNNIAQTTQAVLTDVFTELSFNSKTKLLDNDELPGSNSRVQQSFFTQRSANQFKQIHQWPKSGLQIITDNNNSKHYIQKFLKQYQGQYQRQSQKPIIAYDTGEVTFHLNRVYAVKPGGKVTADIQVVANDGYTFRRVFIDDTDGPKLISNNSYRFEEKSGGRAGKDKEYRLTWQTDTNHKSATPYVFTVRADTNCTFCFDDKFDVIIYVDQSAKKELVGQSVNQKIINRDDFSLTANGSINFDPDFDIQVDLSSGSVKRAEVSVSGTLGLDVGMVLNAQRSAEYQGSKTFYQKSFIKIVVAGGVPIVITGKVNLSGQAKAKTEGSLNVTQKFENFYRTKFGIRYENNQWTEFGESDTQRRYTFNANSASNLSAELRIVPRIDVEFYRVVGFSGSTEPYLYGDGSLEGAFKVIADRDFNSVDANYQFTKLEAGFGLDIKARADFGLIFEKKTVGFCWPNCNDRSELETVYSLPKRKFVSLPTFSINASGNLNESGLNLIINETAGSWFTGSNDLVNGFWKVVPSEGLSIQADSNNFKKATLRKTGTPANSKHTVYFTGYSRFGTVVRQYATYEVDINSGSGSGDGGSDGISVTPPNNLQAVSGNRQVTLRWDYSDNANYFEIYRGSQNNGNDRIRIAQPLASAGNRYTDTSLTANTTYYYWLKACQTGDNCSEFSSVANAKTQNGGMIMVGGDFDTLRAVGNNNPHGIWSNGSTMWVADWVDDKIYAYNLSTKAREPSKDFDTLNSAGNNLVEGIWSNGTSTMWVTDAEDDKIYAYDMVTTTRKRSEDFDSLASASNNYPQGIWSDGTTMWVSDYDDGKIYAYNLSTKIREPSKDFDTLKAAGNSAPEGIWSDGITLWVADWVDDKIYAYDLSTKSRDPAKDFNTLDAAGNNNPEMLWSDGTTMWLSDSHDAKIYAYNLVTKAYTPDAMPQQP